MKKPAFLAFAAGLLATAAVAGVAVVGSGEKRAFDPSGWPAEMKARAPLFETKCANPNCHTMERTVVAVTTGNAPISNTPFDKEAAKAYGIKMMRKPDSGIDKAEAKSLVELLYFLIDQGKK
ncbi:MAG: cytochrome C [Deferrisomatales bacterium]